MGESDQTPEWKINIGKKLIALFAEEEEKIVDLLFFIDLEDQIREDGACPNFWSRFLRCAYECGKDKMLKAYADRLYEDIREYKDHPKLKEAMRKLYAVMNVLIREKKEQKTNQTMLEALEEIVAGNNKGYVAGIGMGVIKTWDVMPISMKIQFVQFVEQIATSYSLVHVQHSIVLLNKFGGKVVGIGLAAIYLTLDIYKNMRRWWIGEISGKRCAMNCTNSLVEIGAGLGGAFAGGTIGSVVMPGFGTIVGSVVGGCIGGFLGKTTAEAITSKIFDLHKDEAVQNAYDFLGVHRTAAVADINSAFKGLCLRYHPDKEGGSHEMFCKLQFHMGVIKLSKGELWA